MPRGTTHDEVGMLGREANDFVLLHDDGGRWRLDLSHADERHLGHRVRVIGIRSGFDLLDVTSLKLAP